MITHIAHVNITVPRGTFDLATEFYGDTLGLIPVSVPLSHKDSLIWFDIGTSGQQVHVGIGENEQGHARHPCFRVESSDALVQLRAKVYEHYKRGGASAPQATDKPGELDSGLQGGEYPKRFFARDFAGNRLEFSL